jgi:sugar lactone lactonase YvrE
MNHRIVSRLMEFYGTWIVISALVLSISDRADGQDVKALRVETLATDIQAGTGGIEVDARGNVYTSDFGKRLGDPSLLGTKIFKITPTGSVSLFAKGFQGASGNAFDSQGNLFQANIRGNTISRIGPDGTSRLFTRQAILSPVGIAIDKTDTLFVCNCGDSSIIRVTKEGKGKRLVRSPLLQCPNGITLDEAGNLYVSNFFNGDVIKITPHGKASQLATLPGQNNGHLVYHRGLLFVVARAAHQVYKVGLDGSVTLFAGTGSRGNRDGEPLNASFSLPNDIAVSPDGRMLYLNEVVPTTGDKKDLSPTRIRRIVLQ